MSGRSPTDPAGFTGWSRARPLPPADLAPDARKLFVEIAAHTTHLQPADAPLLAVYVEAVVQARTCARQIAAGAATADTIRLQRTALSAVYQLGRQLRLTAQQRAPNRSARSADLRGTRASYFDQMDLADGCDDDGTIEPARS